MDVCELGAALECVIANSLEFFVADNAFEGGALGEHTKFNDFELNGEGDTWEGEALLECSRS